MAEISSQKTGILLRILFEVLWHQPDGLSSKEIFTEIPRKIQLSEYERGYYPAVPDMPRFECVLRLASISLVKAGWLLKNNKGRWHVTDLGRRAFENYPEPIKFYQQATQYYQHGKNGFPAGYLALEKAQEEAWEQINKFLHRMEPFEFQILVSDLLQAMGYHISWGAPPSKEHGQIDIIAYTNPLGITGPRIKVQVRHKGQAMTLEGLKSFISVLGNEDYGLLVSSGGFTRDASDAVRFQNNLKLTLMDLEDFYDLWLEMYDKLTHKSRLRLPLKPIHFLSPLSGI